MISDYEETMRQIEKTEQMMKGLSEGIKNIDKGLGGVRVVANRFRKINEKEVNKKKKDAEAYERYQKSQKILHEGNLKDVVKALKDLEEKVYALKTKAIQIKVWS